jgi:hypothetical protein
MSDLSDREARIRAAEDEEVRNYPYRAAAPDVDPEAAESGPHAVGSIVVVGAVVAG